MSCLFALTTTTVVWFTLILLAIKKIYFSLQISRMGSNLNGTFSVDEVYTWLNDNGFQEFSEAFKEEGIDGEVMSCLTESALQSLVGRIGPRMKILRSIKEMQSYSLASSFRSDLINGTSSPSTSSSSWRDQDGDEACSSEHSANGDIVYTPSRPPLSK